jgi:hypothetical protein
MSVSAAKSRVLQAQTLMESGRYDEVAGVLEVGLGFLVGLPDGETAAVGAQIATLRTAAAAAVAAETVRRGGRADVVKADALDRALPLLAEMEERLAADPYAGLSQDEGYAVTSELGNLQERIRAALCPVPADDADVASIQGRLAAANQQIEVAAMALAKARFEGRVAENWSMILSEVAGWEQERPGPVQRPGDVPELPRTRLAILRAGSLLELPETARIRAEHPDNPVVRDVYGAAQGLFDAAGAKLYAAYNRVLDHAEDLPAPEVEADVSRLSRLETATRGSFAGTVYREPLLARIARLEARWQAGCDAVPQAAASTWDGASAGEVSRRWRS